MKKGLVLEGGGMRGLFTAGILDVLMENGITADGAIGVSAGAAFGCNIKSGQIGRALRYNLRFCKDKRYCSLRSLLCTGNLFNADFCYRVVPEQLDLFDAEAYAKNPMEFYVVATDVRDGHAVYHRCDRVEGKGYEWFRASASMPLVSKPVEIGGRKYLDGGISDSIPLEFFEAIGYEKNLVILTRPAGYEKKPNRLLPLMRPALLKYPKVYEAMKRRHKCYNRTLRYIAKREQQGKVLVLCPDAPLAVSRTDRDPERLKEVYRQGRALALRRLDEIRAFLA